MQTAFIGALTPDMVAAGKGSGTTAQTLYAMSKSWDVRSSTQPETVDEEAAMQQLLTEAYDEFELEEWETAAEVPVSVYVQRYPKDVKEETVMEETIETNTTEEETAKEGLYYEEETVMKETVEENTTEEENDEEEPYWESELYYGYSEPPKQHQQQIKHGIQASPIIVYADGPIIVYADGKQHKQEQNIKHGIQAGPINQDQGFQSSIDYLNQQRQERQQQQEQQQQQYKKYQQHQQLSKSRQEDDATGGAKDGCPRGKENAAAGGANDGGQDATAEGVCGCGREESHCDDGGNGQLQVFYSNTDKDDA